MQELRQQYNTVGKLERQVPAVAADQHVMLPYLPREAASHHSLHKFGLRVVSPFR